MGKLIAIRIAGIVFIIFIALFTVSLFRVPEKNQTNRKPTIQKRDDKTPAKFKPEKFIFPKNFIWGVAYSDFQNEGGDGKTDWDNWPVYKKSSVNHPGFTDNDIELAKNLGIKYFRFSIEWAKVEPEKGKFAKNAIAYYVRRIKIMKQKGIEPFVNLNHFTLPLWVAETGGWENDSTPFWFGRYAKKIAQAFAPLKVKWWMTFNEPTVIIETGYIFGTWPPQKKDQDTSQAAMKVFRNLIRAHRLAYKNLHRVLDTPDFKVKVAIAHFTRLLVPHDPADKKDREITKWLTFAINHSFIQAIEDNLDYIGLNYYSRTFVKFNAFGLFFGKPVEFVSKGDGEKAENGAEIYPPGIYELISQFRQYRLPIIITENGVDDERDILRKKFIAEHIKWVYKATQEPENKEAPVIGYFYWTFIDNFEWSYRKNRHFGFVAVDLQKQRKPRSSAYFFRDIVKTNGLTPEILEKYEVYKNNRD